MLFTINMFKMGNDTLPWGIWPVSKNVSQGLLATTKQTKIDVF